MHVWEALKLAIKEGISITHEDLYEKAHVIYEDGELRFKYMDEGNFLSLIDSSRWKVFNEDHQMDDREVNKTLKTWEVCKLLDEWSLEDKPIAIRNKSNLNTYEFHYNEQSNKKGFKFRNGFDTGKVNYKLDLHAEWEIFAEEYEVEKRKWENWGREVNEWKVGDIVKRKHKGEYGEKIGEIESLEFECGRSHVFVSFSDLSFSNKELEMVCLVENRVDDSK